MNENHEKWMRVALQEAKVALKKKEVPVGAVVVFEDKVIGRGYNQLESLKDPTAHAEILAIGAAANFLNSWRLSEAVLYVTLEPCPMCAGAIVLSRLKKLVFGTYDPKSGACGSLYNIVQDNRLNHQIEVIPGILKEECSALLQVFFKGLRKEENE
ncbi:MAG: tRNA adenosine(34) deaminase TadA [candidate division Zixibacteria bacterium]|nr:tRNA adenosine(34) deaminase TadA [candidate division Zixibacteria bacterium]